MNLQAATRLLTGNKWPALALLFILVGVAVLVSGYRGTADLIWTVGLLLVGGPVVVHTVAHALRGHFATDMVASLAIITAILLGEPIAGLVVALMQTGGEALERYAEGRASMAVRDLEAAAPQVAHRIANGEPADIAADEIVVGDVLLVRAGEMIPCDATVVRGASEVTSAHLTGEPLPVEAVPGVRLMSGSINGDSALEIRADAPASESQYARIVQLVRSAQESKAPLQRLADRYAVWFTPITLAVCLVAWLASGDAMRVLAVLVVATPCPLILATPVAIVGGINSAARRSIVVRNGTALEQIGQCTTVVFDKTGTITVGTPSVRGLELLDGMSRERVLQLAGAVEQASSHLLARAVVDEAQEGGASLPRASDTKEYPGRGVSGTVDGHQVVVGAESLIREVTGNGEAMHATQDETTSVLRAWVAVDGKLQAAIDYADELKPGSSELVRELENLGLHDAVLLSGDSIGNTRAVAAQVGIAELHGDLLPADKVKLVRERVDRGEKVLMVGDGTNDAPALAAATVGIALGARGGGITTESADVVLLVDELSRVGEAVRIGRNTLRIARQSIWVGLGLSGVAMVVAALGYIPPTVGALLQEGIDVAVILNALRTSVWENAAG